MCVNHTRKQQRPPAIHDIIRGQQSKIGDISQPDCRKGGRDNCRLGTLCGNPPILDIQTGHLPIGGADIDHSSHAISLSGGLFYYSYFEAVLILNYYYFKGKVRKGPVAGAAQNSARCVTANQDT